MPLANQYLALAQHELLRQIEPAEREQLFALGVERRFSDGEFIFQRGDPGDSMMLVLEGQVKISVLSGDGKELVFAMIRPGECFGEIALLDGQPRSADATAIGSCRLFTLARQDFLPFLERHPRIAIRLMAILCQRLRAASTFTERLAFETMPVRLARLLLKLAETQGVATATGGIRMTGKFSQKELGNLIATSREGVNRQLCAWRAEGLLTLERGHLILLQMDRLKKLANQEKNFEKCEESHT